MSGSGKSTLVHDVIYAGREARQGRRRRERRVGALRVDRGHRVHHRRGARGPDADRAHAAHRTRSPISRRSIRSASCSRRRRTRAAAASPPATSRSTCRAAAARRARARARSASRCSSWPTCSCRATSATASASSRRCSRCKLPGPEHPPGARHDGARGADVLQHVAEGAAAPAGARRDRPRLPPAGAAGDDAVGRRGAAHQDRRAPGVAQAASGCSTSSTSRRPGLHFDDIAKLLARVPQAARAGPHAARHRAQPRRDQDGRLRHRPRARGRRGRRHGGRDGHARAGRGERRRRTPAGFFETVLASSRAHAYAGGQDD